MGGLVGRAYLESGSDKIYKYISAGSPHQGTALAYPAWYGGEIWNNSLVTKIAATLLIKRCGINHKNDMETLREIAPSFRDLLPIYPFLIDKKTGILKGIDTNQWLGKSVFPPTGTATIIATLSGNGFDTLENIITKEPSKKEKKLGLWEEGKPAGKETTTKGDGTVLSKSAKIENKKVTNFEINQNHGGLVTSQEGINTIINFLKGEKSALSATSLITGEEPKSALVMIAYPSTFVSIDPQGKIKRDKHNVVTQINPKSGKYKVGFLPLADESTLLIGQFLKNGDYSWKEYKIKGRLPFAKTIKFDENTLTENPLQ
ncbi:MAG: Glycoside hydrolase [Candidatus Woesebacteria bacterium]|nr:MAG: Glycoside hydrolase [Candidatus Woesebacteria bacterium]